MYLTGFKHSEKLNIGILPADLMTTVSDNRDIMYTQDLAHVKDHPMFSVLQLPLSQSNKQPNHFQSC